MAKLFKATLVKGASYHDGKNHYFRSGSTTVDEKTAAHLKASGSFNLQEVQEKESKAAPAPAPAPKPASKKSNKGKGSK